jgi:hypothetical protein
VVGLGGGDSHCYSAIMNSGARLGYARLARYARRFETSLMIDVFSLLLVRRSNPIRASQRLGFGELVNIHVLLSQGAPLKDDVH